MTQQPADDEFLQIMAEIKQRMIEHSRQEGIGEDEIEEAVQELDESVERINKGYAADLAAGMTDDDILRECLAKAIQARNEGYDDGATSHLIAGMERVLERRKRK